MCQGLVGIEASAPMSCWKLALPKSKPCKGLSRNRASAQPVFDSRPLLGFSSAQEIRIEVEGVLDWSRIKARTENHALTIDGWITIVGPTQLRFLIIRGNSQLSIFFSLVESPTFCERWAPKPCCLANALNSFTVSCTRTWLGFLHIWKDSIILCLNRCTTCPVEFSIQSNNKSSAFS